MTHDEAMEKAAEYVDERITKNANEALELMRHMALVFMIEDISKRLETIEMYTKPVKNIPIRA